MQRGEGMRDREPNGFSLAEVLAVLAIITMILLVSYPVLGESYRGYVARTEVNEMVSDLKAARYIAVSQRTNDSFIVSDDGDTPPNRYSYTNIKGELLLVELTEGVRITTAPATPLVFTADGGLNGSAESIVVESRISADRTDQYTVSISVVGTVTVDYLAITP